MTRATEILCLLLLASVATAADDLPAVPRSWEDPVCRVDGSTILRRDVEAKKQELLPGSSFHGKVEGDKQQELRWQALQTLIDLELKFQDAQRRDLVASRRDVEREFERLLSHYPSAERMRADFERLGVSEKEVKAALKRRLSVARVEAEVAAAGEPVGPAEARSHYESERDSYVLPRRAVVRRLFLRMPPLERSEEDWQKAVARAETLRARCVAGERFEDLIAEASEGLPEELASKGLIGEVHQGQLETALDEALWKLAPGEISQPIRTFKGVHLIRAESILEPRPLAFEEIEEKLVAILADRQKSDRLSAWVAGLRATAKIEILDPDLVRPAPAP